MTDRNIIFDVKQNRNTLIEYEIDPSLVRLPIKAVATYEIDEDYLVVSLQVENCLDHSKIMGNTIRNLKMELCFQSIVESMRVEPIEEEENIEYNLENKTVQWFVKELEWKNLRRVVIKIHDNEKIFQKEIYGKKIKFSFIIPDRVLSEIFVDKIQLSSIIMKKDLKFNLKYETICNNCIVDIAPIGFGRGKNTMILEVFKNVKEDAVFLCGDEIKVIVRLQNYSNERLMDMFLFDEIPNGFELLKGENYWLGYLYPNEIREIIYYVKSKIAGEFLLPSAKVVFKDKDGKRKELFSNSCKIIVKALEQDKKYQVCGNCGSILPVEAKFCGRCGKRVK